MECLAIYDKGEAPESNQRPTPKGRIIRGLQVQHGEGRRRKASTVIQGCCWRLGVVALLICLPPKGRTHSLVDVLQLPFV